MIEQHLKLLGLQVEDTVTGIKGMVSSVCFDAYGCVQALITRKVKEDGTVPDSRWFDVKRLIASGDRIMEAPPHFIAPPGPADKPPLDL